MASDSRHFTTDTAVTPETTIIGARFHTPHAPIHGGTTFLHQDSIAARQFKIRAADSDGDRSSANILIQRRYAWRGYQSAALPREQTAHRVTLTATERSDAIGTITIGLDGPDGLSAEEVFAAEVDAVRDSGRSICEFTKLAIDPITGSKRVLASLFHVAYIIAHRIRGYDTLLIEVNPRHVAYYRRMLGCNVLCRERMNPRVKAPAVLLRLDFEHTREQIGRFAGQPELAASERSLYPYAFSLHEEAGIISRLREEPSWRVKPS